LHRNRSCPAFPTIVASGENATILHYNSLNKTVSDGELLLLDLGAEYGHYSADISRTFPVSGRFTSKQRDIYNLVVEANIQTIEAIKPGIPISNLDEIAKRVLCEGMKKLGYIKKDAEISKYFTHGVSHHLGLDTHDVHSEKPTTLQPGMVITVEPGLYLPEFQIGIRIEDDVVVTKEGQINLSKAIPKKADEVESWIQDVQSKTVVS
ncbi:M24 family metallopeptidase, partial [bacterium]|nr:M24 family metallopeptidase [bacterium]